MPGIVKIEQSIHTWESETIQHITITQCLESSDYGLWLIWDSQIGNVDIHINTRNVFTT